MKRRPLIITACIASICFIGICFTLFTRSYIDAHLNVSNKRDLSEKINVTFETESVMETAETLEEKIAVAQFGAEMNDNARDIEEPEMEAAAETEALMIVDEEEESRMSKEEELTAYLEKLAGLEDLIALSWEELRKNDSKPSVQQEQAVADQAYKIWDDELNAIYKMLRGKLLDEDFDILKKEERLWLKERDEAAESAALGVSNGSIQKLRYTMSLSETTKERTYELVEMYFDVDQVE